MDVTSPVKLDNNGDVLLQIPVTSGSTMEILVSSKVLSLASVVFRAMFASAFKESQDLLNGQLNGVPMKLDLPDDDSTGVLLLSALLHFKYEDYVELYKDPDHVYSMAVVADKYDCTSALRFITRGLFSPSLQLKSIPATRKWLVISYLLDQPKYFALISKTLILRDTQSFMSLDSAISLPGGVAGKFLDKLVATAS